jgi:hypothetical protein
MPSELLYLFRDIIGDIEGQIINLFAHGFQLPVCPLVTIEDMPVCVPRYAIFSTFPIQEDIIGLGLIIALWTFNAALFAVLNYDFQPDAITMLTKPFSGPYFPGHGNTS